MSENKLPQIPKEWRWVKLEEVSYLITDGTHKTPKYQEKGVRFISIANIKPFEPINWEAYEKYISYEEHLELIKRAKPEKDDILFPRIGTLGFAKRIDFDEEVSIFVGLGLVKPIKKYVLPKYIEYYMNTPYVNKYSHEKATGTGRLTLPLHASKSMPFPLSPLPEQQKIVEILEEAFSKIDAGVEGLKKIKKLLSLYRQSVLKNAFEGKLTEKWRKENKEKLEPAEKLIEKIKKEREERYQQELEEWKKACEIAKKEGKKKPPKPKPPKELPPITEEELKNLPEIPREWRWVRLGEVGTIYSGGTPSTKIPEYWGGEIPWITPADLSVYKQKYISKGRKSISRLGLENSSAVLMPAGTVLFSSRAPIGYVAIASNPVSTNQGFKNIYPYKSILSDFIYYYLKFAKELIENMGSGTTFKEVSAKIFNLIPFPLLSLSEQQKIVEEIEYRLSIADKLEETVDKLLEKAEKLKQSYLKSAFEGKLTEEWRKQNLHLITGENSVDKLLGKIKAEKEKFEKQKKKPKVKQKSLIGTK